MIEGEPDSAGQLFTEGESVEATAFAALAELESAFDQAEFAELRTTGAQLPIPQRRQTARRDGGQHPGPRLRGPERVSTLASTGADAKNHGELGEDQQR